MPAISELPDCPLCFGGLLPLSVCHSCNTVAVLEGLREVLSEMACENCGTSNPSHFVCSACHSRFPFEDIVKPEGPTCPACKSPVPIRAEICPNCSAVLPVAGTAPGRLKRRIRGEYGAEDVREVSRIPNLGRQRAESLCRAGYNRLWKIQRAPEADIANVDGIGPENAAKIREALRFLLVIGQRKTKDDVLSEEWECPLCGTVTSLFATRCHDCGAAFDDEELDEEFRKEVAQDEEKGLLAYYDVRLLESPDDLALLYARGVLLLAMGHPAETLTALDAVLALAPGHRKALQAKARALAAAKGHGAASQILRETLQSVPPIEAPPPGERRKAATEAEGAAEPTAEGKAAERAAEEAFASLGALAEVEECPECGEPLKRGAVSCPVCGHRLAPETPGAFPPTEPQTFEEEHILDDLQRVISGEEKAPPPPLEPEVSKTVITGKRVMLAFLTKIPGVSKRAADAVSGFFQDLEQVGLADVIDIAEVPGVAPAEARLIKVAVARFLAPAGPPTSAKREAPKAPAARAAPEVPAQLLPPKPEPKPAELPGRRPEGAPAPRPSGFEVRRGMVNGRGHVNGRGRVNGVINGTGFVNGVALAKLELPRRSLLPRYIAIGVSLLMLFAFTATFVAPLAPPSGIRVDGYFGDWANESVPVYIQGTVSGNPNVRIVDSSVHDDPTRSKIYLRVGVEGEIFGDPTDWDTMYGFLDTDGFNSTGYDLGDLGADYVAQVSGSASLVEDARLLRYDASGRTRDDWAGFVSVGPVEAAAGGSQVEVSIPRAAIGGDLSAVRVRFAFDDNAGETSHTPAPLGTQEGALLVEQSPETTTLSAGRQPFLTLTFTSLARHSLLVRQVQVAKLGLDTFSPDPIPDFTVSDTPVTRTITVDATGAVPGTLVTAIVTDMRVEAMEGPVPRGRPFAIVGPAARAYVSGPPPGKVIDGLFADWIVPIPAPDTDATPISRRSLNVLSIAGNVTGNRISLYTRLGGEAFEGAWTPDRPSRPPPPGPGGGPPAPPAPPASLPPLVGQDYIRFYVDSDAATPGGVQFGGVSADRLLEVRGRGGRVTNASVYGLSGSNWVREGSLDWGLGGDEIEVGASLVGLPLNGTEFAVASGDWAGVADRTDSAATRGAASGATRSAPESPVVLDISGNGPFWFRDANHATETACTYNKVASSTKGSGPAKTITLNPGETACWYVDATTGQTIPAGDWETLMDLSNSGGAVYDVLIQIWNLDTNDVAETIQSCVDQSSFGDDVQCLATSVASKTLTSNQVVRIVFAHSDASGTVTVEYDDSDGSGDSRTTLPIPEFSDVAGAALAVSLLTLVAQSKRRRRR